MKIGKTETIALMVLIFVIACLAACTGTGKPSSQLPQVTIQTTVSPTVSPTDPIIGTWRGNDPKATPQIAAYYYNIMNITPTGNFSTWWPRDEPGGHGTWSKLSNNVYRIGWEHYIYEPVNDTLASDNYDWIYHRMK
jgi:hypothetical protein